MNIKSIELQAIFIIYASLLFLAVITGSFTLQLTTIAIPVLLLLYFFAVYYPLYYAYLLLLALPVSVNLKNIGMGMGISLPAEIMILFLAGLIALNIITGRYVNKEIIFHPVTLAILINLLWMLITSFTSSMPLISIKFMLIRIAFILAFYLFFMHILGNKKGIQQFFWLFMLTFSVVIIYILLRHAHYGFVQQVNRYVTKPFFNDHTIYGASLAMLLPFFILSLFISSAERIMPKFSYWLIIPLLLTAIFFSYSRAVWLSIALLIPLIAVIILKIRFAYLLLALCLLVLTTIYFRGPLVDRMKNVESERGSDIREHAGSIANINTSASNMERINRWESALLMFLEKPLLGFGPGTYAFQYGAYQREESLTRISTFYGDKGGAHSEYLKPLSESGLFGLISFLAILLFTAQTAIRLIRRSKDIQLRMLAMALLLGLVTYYIHGFVNFFLDTDKTSALFWGMTGLLVALDIKYKKEKRTECGKEITNRIPDKS